MSTEEMNNVVETTEEAMPVEENGVETNEMGLGEKIACGAGAAVAVIAIVKGIKWVYCKVTHKENKPTKYKITFQSPIDIRKVEMTEGTVEE